MNDKNSNRSLLGFAFIVGVALIAYLAWILVSGTIQIRRATPPETVTNFEQFIVWRPNVREFRVISFNGAKHLDAIGPYVGPLPSDRSSYVFNGAGKLTHWSMDIGDDGQFQDELNIYQQAERVSLEQAKQWLRDASSPQ